MKQIMRIKNENSTDYVEIFKGVEIRIKAGKHILMNSFDANDFKRTRPVLGVIKKISITPDLKEDKTFNEFECDVCNKICKSKHGLIIHKKVHKKD